MTIRNLTHISKKHTSVKNGEDKIKNSIINIFEVKNGGGNIRDNPGTKLKKMSHQLLDQSQKELEKKIENAITSPISKCKTIAQEGAVRLDIQRSKNDKISLAIQLNENKKNSNGDSTTIAQIEVGKDIIQACELINIIYVLKEAIDYNRNIEILNIHHYEISCSGDCNYKIHE